jgi:hypothetical protein
VRCSLLPQRPAPDETKSSAAGDVRPAAAGSGVAAPA